MVYKTYDVAHAQVGSRLKGCAHTQMILFAFVKFFDIMVVSYCKEVQSMCTAVSYKKLFKLMIDRDMKKKDLQQAAGLSPATITKLGNNSYVSMEVLVKICQTLCVDIGDIMEIAPAEHEKQD